MIHPDTELRFVSDEVGNGVFAQKLIPRGTIVYVQDELEVMLTEQQYSKLNAAHKKIVEKYSYIDQAGRYILSWDNAKYVNHRCDFNTISTGYGFEIAVRDIAAGEELTDEYGLFNLSKPMRVTCGCRDCRGMVMPDDAERYADRWDAMIVEALACLQDVAQPLMQYMEKNTLRELLDYLDGSRPYVSVRNLRWRNEEMLEMTA
jgi:hypothetical protein